MPSLYLRDSLSHICYSSPNWPPNSPVFDILAAVADHDTDCTQEALLVIKEETRMRRNFYHSTFERLSLIQVLSWGLSL